MTSSGARRVFALVLTGLLVWLAGATGYAAAAAESAPTEGEPVGRSLPTVIVMDTSGSMDDKDPSGTVKIDAAKSAVLDIISTAPTDADFAFITYPGSAQAPSKDCREGTVRIALGPLNHQRAYDDVRKMRAGGDTPTSAALEQAGRLLDARGYRKGTVVLVSDGLANCGPPPCETATQLRQRGLDVVIHTIGFGMAEVEGQEALRCIAESTGGQNYEADQADQLGDALNKAAASTLDVTHDMPATMPPVAGLAGVTAAVSSDGSPGVHGTRVRVRVTNTGTSAARDVRASLHLMPVTAAPGAASVVNVAPPVRYLGNLSPDGTREVTFVVRPQPQAGELGWHLTVISGNGPPTRLDGRVRVEDALGPGALGAVLRDAKRVVVLGDSYSSGEGAPPFLEGTAGRGAENWCHRSTNAYGAVIWGDQTDLVACSGAVTADFTGSQHSGGGTVEPQQDALAALVRGDEGPDAVLLTFGGNDIGFSTIVKKCMFGDVRQLSGRTGPYGSDCANEVIDDGDGTDRSLGRALTLGQGRIRRAEQVKTSLVLTYQRIDAVVNSADAVNRRGRAIPVVVLPYVALVPQGLDPATQKGGCMLMIGPEEVAFFNELIGTLNQSVREAVDDLRAEGRPFFYVDGLAEAFQPNHTICENTESYGVKLTAEEVRAALIGFEGDAGAKVAQVTALTARAGALMAGFRVSGFTPGGLAQFGATVAELSETMKDLDELTRMLVHPNADGYRAEARALTAWSQQVGPIEAGPAPERALRARGVSWADRLVGGIGDGLRIAAGVGEVIRVRAGGFAPLTDLVIWQESTPVVIASARADGQGQVDTWARLSPALPPGEHHLVVEGEGGDGRFRAESRPVTVAESGHRAATLAGLAGAWLVLAALAGWGIRRASGGRRTGPKATGPGGGP